MSLIVDVECVGIDTASDYLEPVEPDPKLLEPIEPDSRLKDPAKVAENLAKVERLRAERPAQIEASIKERTEKLIEKCALDPDLCRIVALGCGDADGPDTVLICRDEETEAAALAAFWKRVIASDHFVRTLVSFNGFGYDLPVLVRRSQYLGVAHPVLNLDRYRSPHIDLMQRLTFNGAIKAHSLRFYSSRFGMPVMDDHDGSQIAQLVKDGNWKAVEEHCLADLARTRFVAQKLRLVNVPSTVAA
jgi:hypothetical protein